MPIIKFVNEDNNKRYDTEDSVRNCIEYIFDVSKTFYDEVRTGHMCSDFVGCVHFMGTRCQEIQPELVANQMIINNSVYGKAQGNLLKHRIISFHNADSVMPNEAFDLAHYIANIYGENYITAHGVHMDTNQIHIHLVVDTISWRDGKRFSFSFEKRWMTSLVNAWMNSRNDNLISNWKANETCERYYGY